MIFKKKNLIDELVEYIQSNLKKGYTKDSLKWALIDQGYSRIEVERAFKKLDLDLAKTAPILKSKPQIKYEVVEKKDIYSSFKEKQKETFLKKLFKI